MLVVGEALIDVVERASGPRDEHVGGSPANVALGLARLGIPTRLRTAIGRDGWDERIERHLAASGVDVDVESRSLETTSSATASISESGSATYDFSIDWVLEEPIELRDAGIVHVGSIACFIEPGASELLRWIQALPMSITLTFDPNIRPALVGERTRAVAITELLASRADVVKLSDEDAAWLYPELALDDVLDRLLSRGARVTAVTKGREGASIGSAEARVDVNSRRVHVADTIGAGDTFMAVLVAQLAEGRLSSRPSSLARAGELAALAASMTVSRVGAALPDRAELERAASDL